MSEIKFDYDEERLSLCARSELAAAVAADRADAMTLVSASKDDDDEPCSQLFQEHALHFRRSPTTGLDHHYHLNRFHRFVKSVQQVDLHNSNPSNQHRIALNRFADQDDTTIPLFPNNNNDSMQDSTSLWDSTTRELLFSDDPMEIAANWTVGHGGMDHLNPKKRKKSKVHARDVATDKLKFPTRVEGHHPFEIPTIDDPIVEGDLIRVKPRNKIEQELLDRRADDNSNSTDAFSVYLNWATQDNPDGVQIVKDAFDQGECGSCWAFTATGSLEASVSRTQAREAYQEFLERVEMRRDDESQLKKLHEEAFTFAQSVEEAAFQMANLSIQELIDCDTAADLGCVGGNPLLSFYFIYRFGLTTWSQYPYVGHEDECYKRLVSRPIAKVKAWGVVSPNHENHMELVLRYIGPIAVGVNAADRSFLAYQEGIFNKPNCRQGANHAILVTGYGEERGEDGEVVKYWIARNSWGKGWGENGYIRVKRGDGLKGTLGVCGIAESPSVALGGVLLTNRHRLAPYHHAPNSPWSDSDPLSTSQPSSPCARFGLESCHAIVDMVQDNKAILLGVVAIFCATLLAAWPLSLQCRRRRQRRRRARQMKAGAHRIVGATNPIPSAPVEPSEVDPLLGSRGGSTNYTGA
ncbi:Senescence-specific cysteine protease SAG39 [Seminavis robusta]|uniref:Senescence-specific cysteine protease SAG39 n=1 Tax=Seminavis robusta TaxID=568900 RepID=A0A9N8HN93_9STRA|nr:Senescence-specific cysteine protease SAG39 [Seminavis robusta]|eukprot:Sro971_g226500.1 Senescence-specific cysteine protease SAG39 (636) ;mRNA; r:31771-33867